MRCVKTALCGVLAAGPVAADTFDCVINPAVTVQVGSAVSGLLADVYVDQGDLVTPGQKIATLRSDIEATTIDVLAVQANSSAEVDAQKSRLTLSQQRLERVQEMVKRNIAPEEELEVAEAELQVVSGELAIAKMRNAVALLELERAREQLGQREIVSPIDGVVVARHLFRGEFLDLDRPVVTISQVSLLHVEVFLPVSFYGSVAPGMPLTILPNAPLTGTREGVIEVVDRVFDAASGTFGVRAVIDNTDLSIPAGHRCQIEITATGG